jgi:hypothetical protein
MERLKAVILNVGAMEDGLRIVSGLLLLEAYGN